MPETERKYGSFILLLNYQVPGIRKIGNFQTRVIINADKHHWERFDVEMKNLIFVDILESKTNLMYEVFTLLLIKNKACPGEKRYKNFFESPKKAFFLKSNIKFWTLIKKWQYLYGGKNNSLYYKVGFLSLMLLL